MIGTSPRSATPASVSSCSCRVRVNYRDDAGAEFGSQPQLAPPELSTIPEFVKTLVTKITA